MGKKIALFGFGRLGREINHLLPEYDFHCQAILAKNKRDEQASIFTSLHDLTPTDIDIVIEAALREGFEERVDWAVAHNKPLIVATTGWQEIREDILKKVLDAKIPFVWSSNYSLGVWLFRKLVKEASRHLKDPLDFDCALFEAHHKQKKDAPSGTLLSILQDIQTHAHSPKAPFSSINQAIPPLEEPSIDIASMRVGSVPGTHMVWLDGQDETIQLTHTTRDRRTFARGIIKAAQLLDTYPDVWEFDDLVEYSLFHT